MTAVFYLLTVQIALGAFDNLWHHRISEKLPQRRVAALETALHAAREGLYVGIFFTLAWWQPHGLWAWVLLGVLVIELLITVLDFLIEAGTRRRPRLERVLHTILAVNAGAILASLMPALLSWSELAV